MILTRPMAAGIVGAEEAEDRTSYDTHRPMLFRREAALIFAAVVCACSRDRAIASIDDPGEWRTEEAVRIGHVEDSALGVSSIGAVRVHPSGRIYVLETDARQVRIFSADGRLVRTTGRRGQGPGEFENPSGMGFLGDTVWVTDTRRMTLLSADGDLLTTSSTPRLRVPVGDPPLQATVYAAEPRSGGTFTGIYAFPFRPGQQLPDSIRVPRLQLDTTGKQIDTVGWQIVRFMPVLQLPRGGRGGRGTVIPHPVVDLPIPVFLPNGDVLEVHGGSPAAADAEIRFVFRDSTATAYRSLSFDYRPVPLTDSAADATIEGLVGRMEQMGMAAPEARRLVDSLRLPRFQRGVTGAFRADDGTIWLRREQMADGAWRWTLLTPEAAPLAETRLPRTFRFQVARDDHVWGIETDSLDVPWVVGYRLLRN